VKRGVIVFLFELVSIATAFDVISYAQSEQRGQIRICLINGRSGQPVSNNHLLVRGALDKSGDGSKVNIGVNTDKDGYVTVSLPTQNLSAIEIWTEWYQPCSKTRTFPVEQLLHFGIVSENSCKPKITQPPAQGTLIFYIRPETFFEKMAH
jgi:hypothetical protein